MGLDQLKEIHIECSVLKIENVKNTRGCMAKTFMGSTISPAVHMRCGEATQHTNPKEGCQSARFNGSDNNTKLFDFYGWNKTPEIIFTVTHKNQPVARCIFDLKEHCGDHKADKRNVLTFTQPLYFHKNFKNAVSNGGVEAGDITFSLVWTGLDFSDPKNFDVTGTVAAPPATNPQAGGGYINQAPSAPTLPAAPVTCRHVTWQFQTANGWKNMDYKTSEALERLWNGLSSGLNPIFTEGEREYNVQTMVQSNKGSSRTRALKRLG